MAQNTWFGTPDTDAKNWSLYPALQSVDMDNNNVEQTNLVRTQAMIMDGSVLPPAWKATTGGNDTDLYRISGDFAGSMRITDDVNNPLATKGFLLDSDVNVPTLTLNGNTLDLRAKDPDTDPSGVTQKVLSSVNLTGANFFKAAQQYKSAQQTAPSGNVDVTFDLNQPWSDVTAITQTSPTDFVVNTAGIYQLEFALTQLANGQTWGTTTNKAAVIDITRTPIAKQAILLNSAFIASGQTYGLIAVGTIELQAGDVINCRSVNALSSGGNGLIQCVQSTFDYNTTFTWTLLNTSSTGIKAIASFSSTATQVVSGADTPTPIAHDTTDYTSGGFTLTGGNIQVNDTGVQQIDVSVQLDKSGGGVSPCDLWFQLNGSDVANSASQVVVAGNNGETLLNVPQLLLITAGQVLSVVFASSDATMTATHFAAQALPYPRPAVPSIITRIQRVG